MVSIPCVGRPGPEKASAVADWVEAGLLVPEGEGAGGPVRVLPWQREFLGRVEADFGSLG